jgi:HSP20 family protein
MVPSRRPVERRRCKLLTRFDPFHELDRLSQWLCWGRQDGLWRLGAPLDAYRRGDRFVVQVDLPGVEPSSVDVSVDGNVVTIRADRSWAPSEGDEVLVAERPLGSVSRQLFLGEALDADAIEASYDEGVLTLAIPVAGAAKPRRVAVTVGSRPELNAA